MKHLCLVLITMLCAIGTTLAQRTIIQDAPAAISVQPAASAAVCENTGTITLTLTATGTSPMYQWQDSSGGVWSNLSNGGVYSGVSDDSLVLTAPPVSFNGKQFRCIVTSGGACGNSVTSSTVAVAVDANPVVTVDPSPATVCAGLPASFSVTATGAGLAYQWQENGVNLSNGGAYSNVTTATMNISDVTGLNNKQYQCVVSGTCGTPVTSDSVALTVNELVAITSQPTVPAAVCSGSGTQTFSVAATGTGLTYQWQEDNGGGFTNITNGGIYSGATDTTLTLTDPTSAVNGYQYQVIVTGTCAPPVTSNAIATTINPLAVVTVAPTAQSVCASGSLYSNSCTFSLTNADATYQWQENPGSGWVNVSGAYYSGGTTSSLIVTDPLASMTGTQYRCQLTTIVGGCVSYTTPVSMTVNPLPADLTWLIDGSAADTMHDCLGGLDMTLNPTQGANIIYELQLFPSATVVTSVTGNNGIRTITGQGAGVYQFELRNTTTGCGYIKLD